MPVHLYLGGKPVTALLVPADERMVLPVGLLLLLPLHWMLLGLVLVHRPWMDAAPPYVELVFTQLALPAPLLGMNLFDVFLDLRLPTECRTAALPPGAGVADEGVNSVDVLLPATSSTEGLVALVALKSSYLLVHSLDVLLQVRITAVMKTTLGRFKGFLLQMNSLKITSHMSLLIKPLPTLWAHVDHPFME